MKKTLLVVLLSLFCSSSLFSQIKLDVKASVNNTFRYGNGYEYAGLNKFEKEYFENLTDARLSVNDIIFGLRYEISDPIEYGLDFKGIRKRFVEYNNNNLGVNLRAGDFWEIFSRGMTLNVFEDRTLAYDTGIDGIRLGYENTFNRNRRPVRFRAQVLGGDLNYSDFLNPERVEDYQIRNANFDISPIRQLTIGGGYVYSKGRIPSSGDTTSITADLPEVNVNLNLDDFQFYTSYAHKHINSEPNTLAPDPISADGDGLYSSASFSKGGLGVTLEYKNYRFDLTAPDNRSADRPTKMLPFQNPPTAQREHTSTLISRNPHVVDFNDEVGGQLDIIYVANDKLTFNINGSVASKHYEYADIDTSSRIVYQRVDRSDDYIPNLDDKYSPFWEFYLESEYYATDKIYTKLAYARQSETIFNSVNPLSSEKIMVTTIPAEFRYEFNNEYALKLVLEQQWLNNSIRLHQKSFMNQLVQVNVTKSPQLSFTLNAEFTNDEEEPTGKQSWFLGEVLYKLNQTNTITLSYGSERGGLRCTNGICRFVNPFEGFRMTIQSQF